MTRRDELVAEMRRVLGAHAMRAYGDPPRLTLPAILDATDELADEIMERWLLLPVQP